MAVSLKYPGEFMKKYDEYILDGKVFFISSARDARGVYWLMIDQKVDENLTDNQIQKICEDLYPDRWWYRVHPPKGKWRDDGEKFVYHLFGYENDPGLFDLNTYFD